MRYVPVARLKEGMELAIPLYSDSFGVLIREGVRLSGISVRRINEMGYGGLYINDELSEGIDVNDIISQELRLRTLKSSKDILRLAVNGASGEASKIARDRQRNVIMPVLESIIDNRRRIVDMIDLRTYDDYEYYHAANVTVLSLLLGVTLGLTGRQLFDLGLAALLHDMGNIFIPGNLLHKPGRYTPEEFETVKQHAQKGFDYLRARFDISIEACMGALQHHENYDGSGYPNALKKDKISIYGRVVYAAEVFDSMTSRRPFRAPMLPSEAIGYLGANAGTLFDPAVVDAFKRVAAPYPSGMCLELANGERCVVVKNTPDACERPVVRIINADMSPGETVDLGGDANYKDVEISGVIEL